MLKVTNKIMPNTGHTIIMDGMVNCDDPTLRKEILLGPFKPADNIQLPPRMLASSYKCNRLFVTMIYV